MNSLRITDVRASAGYRSMHSDGYGWSPGQWAPYTKPGRFASAMSCDHCGATVALARDALTGAVLCPGCCYDVDPDAAALLYGPRYTQEIGVHNSPRRGAK